MGSQNSKNDLCRTHKNIYEKYSGEEGQGEEDI